MARLPARCSIDIANNVLVIELKFRIEDTCINVWKFSMKESKNPPTAASLPIVLLVCLLVFVVESVGSAQTFESIETHDPLQNFNSGVLQLQLHIVLGICSIRLEGAQGGTVENSQQEEYTLAYSVRQPLRLRVNLVN
ncbi:hypothetical protein AVEN_213270-1 [Araneus ventricosus]|uniref:Uncharacterized protein n=1 Tax=Araneus ventricosus TaxID=182803 RepID=A0A4Y2DFM2_ARAVE|nr:hypothetical protein AVEN_213270-1 [Araneus ventricosus]